MTRTTRTVLEPIAGPVAGVALAHVLLGLLLWTFLPLWKTAHPTHAEYALLDWKVPEDFLLGRRQQQPPLTPTPGKAPAHQAAPVAAVAPAPVVTARPAPPLKPVSPSAPTPVIDPTATVMAPPPQSADGQHPANKYITLSSLRGDHDAAMGTVDDAVQKAFMKAWQAPAIQQVPAGKRSAALNLTIGRDGTVLEAKMSKAADGAVLDASIREAAEQVKKIPLTLPASFPKERYDLQVNFLIE